MKYLTEKNEKMKRTIKTIFSFIILSIAFVSFGVLESCTKKKDKQEEILSLLEESKKNSELYRRNLKAHKEVISQSEQAIDSILYVIYTSKNPILREYSSNILKPFTETITKRREMVYQTEKALYKYEYVEKNYGAKTLRGDGNFAIKLKSSNVSSDTLCTDSTSSQ